MLIVVGSLLVSTAQARECPDGGNWPIKDWWAKCTSEVIAQLELDDLLITNEYHQAVECDDTRTTGVAAATRSELEEASVWLESLCFRKPNVLVDQRSEDDPLVYVAWVSEDIHRQPGKPDTLGLYRNGNLYVDLTSFFAMGDATGVGDDVGHERRVSRMSVMVHELFHAIQAQYPIFGGPKPKWVVEATAVAVQIAWQHHTGLTDATARDRVYDVPLHRPDSLANHYRTFRWWLWLGEALASPDRVGYLADLMIEHDFAEHEGLADLESWLDARGLGLYELYPEFVAQSIDGPGLFDDVHDEALRFRADRTVEEEHAGRVREIAAEAVRVGVEVPEGESAQLTIRIRPDHDDLHLAVGNTNYSTPGPRSGFSAIQNDLKPEFRDPGWVAARNVFRTVVTGGGDGPEFLARVSNVGRDPVATDARDFRLEFELEPIDGCSFSAALSGDTTSTSAAGRVAHFSTSGGSTSTGLMTNPGNVQGMAGFLEQLAGDRMSDEERAELRAGAAAWQREAASLPTETLGITLIEMDPAAGANAQLASALGGFRLTASVFDQPIEPGFQGGLEPGLIQVLTGDFDRAVTAQTRFAWAPGEPGSGSIEITDYQDDRLTGTINAVLEAQGVRNADTGEPLRLQVSASFLAKPHNPLQGQLGCLPED